MSEVATTQQPQPQGGTLERVKGLLATKAIRGRFEEVLGGKAAGFMSSIVSAVSANKDLLNCEPMSVISAAAVAASMDLPINQNLGFAHIVPYKGVAQFQMGWKGFVQLAMRTGQYKTINLTPVLEGQITRHDPFSGEMEFQYKAASDKIVGYLLFFRLLNGFEKYFYMTREQCEAHGKRYSATFKKGFGKWVDDFDAMALKTVCKMGLSKYGILSVEMQKAIELDQAEVDGDGKVKRYPDAIDADATVAETEPGAGETGPRRLRAAVGADDKKPGQDQAQQPAGGTQVPI